MRREKNPRLHIQTRSSLADSDDFIAVLDLLYICRLQKLPIYNEVVRKFTQRVGQKNVQGRRGLMCLSFV